MSEPAEILFEKRGAIGLITLNRPKALNALTHAMCVSMKAQLAAWAEDAAVKCIVIQGEGERAFCAGGDIRTLYDSGKAGTPYALAFYRDEYLLNAAIKHYPKPYIALLRGFVMGGGVGVSVHGTIALPTRPCCSPCRKPASDSSPMSVAVSSCRVFRAKSACISALPARG